MSHCPPQALIVILMKLCSFFLLIGFAHDHLHRIEITVTIYLSPFPTTTLVLYPHYLDIPLAPHTTQTPSFVSLPIMPCPPRRQLARQPKPKQGEPPFSRLAQAEERGSD